VAKIGHEPGHVAQQRTGHVKPTEVRGGVPVNESLQTWSAYWAQQPGGGASGEAPKSG
jgi:hypothetical protein